MIRLLVPLLLAACTAPAPAPVPDRVDPPRGFVGDDTLVRVIGTRFYPALQIPAAGGSPGADEAFDLRLWGAGGAEPIQLLADFESLNVLRAVVPRGLPVGVYDVEVVSPSGAAGVKEGGFEVTSTRVDRIELGVDDFVGTVGEVLAVRISIVDSDGVSVSEDLPVRVEVDPELAAELGVSLYTEELEDRVPDRDGFGAVGRLGTDGGLTVRMRALRPGSVRLRVSTTEEDSPVRDDDVVLEWTPGTAVAARIDLGPDFQTVKAGTPFLTLVEAVDAQGNVATDGNYRVLLGAECGSWRTVVDLVQGRRTVEVAIPEATSSQPDCAHEAIRASFDLSGTSAPFQVVPAELDGLVVQVVGLNDVAAGQAVPITVAPVDAYGNRPAVEVSIDGVSTPGDPGLTWSCPAQITVDRDAFCEVRLTRAQAGVVLAVAGGGLVAQSEALGVHPGPPAVLDLALRAQVWVAGDRQDVDLTVTDAFGNAVSSSAVSRSDLDVFDARYPSGRPSADQGCTPPQETGPWSCRYTVATGEQGTHLTARWTDPKDPAHVVFGQSAALVVQNSILAAAVITPAAGEAQAGVPLDVLFEARDAYGNAYLQQSTINMGVRDSTGTMTPKAVTLRPDGTALARAVFTRAGTTRVSALSGGVELGVSEPIQVLPGALTGLSVVPTAPYAWVSESLQVRVETVDAYGNRVPGDGDVTLTSRDGRGPVVGLRLVNGVAVGGYTWSAWDEDDALVGAAPGLSGTSASVSVLRRCVTGAPLVGVGFPSGPEVRPYGLACTDEDGDGSVWVDLASSLPAAGRALLRFGVALGSTGVASGATGMRISLPGVGQWNLVTYVVQDDGCGAISARDAYAGPDDGRVVGPIVWSARPSLVDLERLGAGADLEVTGVHTCKGAPADDTWVRVRTDLGELVGPGVQAGPGGLRLDIEAGKGSARLDLGSTDAGDPARVSAWVDGGQARGRLDVALTGDLRAPVVWNQLPRGPLEAPVGTLLLELSERMLPASAVGAFRIEGEPGLDVTATVDGRLVQLDVDPPLRADGTVYEVIVEPTFTDLAGNGLAGTWSGGPAVYRGLVGASGSPDAVTSCSVDAAVIRPDGYAGEGVEADEVVMSFASASVPAWWVAEVRDGGGLIVVHDRFIPDAPAGTWVWDARDAEGRVVDAGSYALSLDAEGSGGNRGGACVRAVTVEIKEGGK